MSIVVFGSINMDLTTYVPRLPQPGETLFGSSFITVPGGKGGNQAVAAARLGASVHFCGRVGPDGFGRDALAALEGDGVDVSGVIVDPEHNTGLAVISVDDDAENSIIVISGANMALGDTDVTRCLSALDSARVLLLQLEVPLEANIAIARAARERGVTVVLDPAPARELPAEFLELIDIITPNEVEAEMLVGFAISSPDDAGRAAKQLRSQGIGTAVVKLGGQGAFFETDGEGRLVPAFEVEPVDTVAAGDAFNAGLGVALASGQDIAEAVRWGAAAGALAVTQAGAFPSMPHREDLDNLLRKGAT